MERLIELGKLLDWYAPLLTPRQAALVRQYAYEDCSLSEIAEREGITRQGVRDSIAHAEEEMLGMEQKLHLVKRVSKTRTLAGSLLEQADDPLIAEGLRDLIQIWEDDDGV